MTLRNILVSIAARNLTNVTNVKSSLRNQETLEYINGPTVAKSVTDVSTVTRRLSDPMISLHMKEFIAGKSPTSVKNVEKHLHSRATLELTCVYTAEKGPIVVTYAEIRLLPQQVLQRT